MPILKNKTQGNFICVSQNFTKDKNLSLSERGLLLTLLSLPNNWGLSIRGLSRILLDGQDKISKELNSLITKGYITRTQVRNERGNFSQITLEVHEFPVTTNDNEENCLPNKSEPDMANPDTVNPYTENPDTVNPYTENPDTVNPYTENPDTVNPYTENPDTVNPYTENPSQYNNYNKIKQTVNNQRECLMNTLPKSDYDKLVSEFGESNVNYHIQRISAHHYKGCMNYATIKAWCEERLPQMSQPQYPAKTKGSFFNFQQHADYDFDELEDILTGPSNLHAEVV